MLGLGARAGGGEGARRMLSRDLKWIIDFSSI